MKEMLSSQFSVEQEFGSDICGAKFPYTNRNLLGPFTLRNCVKIYNQNKSVENSGESDNDVAAMTEDTEIIESN